MSRIFATAAVLLLLIGPVHGQNRIEPKIDDDGLYTQPWFLTSFLELKEDLAEARAEGKAFLIIWEQRGCIYCRELHTQHLADPLLNQYMRENFVVLQLNLHGDREVTDFRGARLTEREFARRLGVRFTPTLLFYPTSPGPREAENGGEMLRFPGLIRPGELFAALHFVRDAAHHNQTFQQFLAADGAKIARRLDP
jgi:thioredoxin-related protein